MKEFVEFATDDVDANNVTSKAQMQIMLPSMERVVDFKKHVCEWKRKTTNSPELFCTHFIKAYKEMVCSENSKKGTHIEKANNAFSLDQLQQILDSVGVPSMRHEQANIYMDSKLLELIKRLTEKVSMLESEKSRASTHGKKTKEGKY